MRSHYCWCTGNVLMFTPPPNTAPQESNSFDHKKGKNTPHSTLGTHFVILEMALGPLWPVTFPNKYPTPHPWGGWTPHNSTLNSSRPNQNFSSAPLAPVIPY